ncbi:MAG: TonB-dependent receptor [Lysobacter sp.]|nr:TonB-dependent receptor [Lysobacter sp.]
MRKKLFLASAAACLPSAAIAQTQTQTQVQADRGAPTPGQGQEAGDSADIVVTAQRRSERLQDIPMAVTALSGETFERGPIVNLIDVQSSVPNLNISPRVGSGVVAIRGIGFAVVTAGAEGSVALHADGVYQSRPFAALSGLFDVSRIEVARGPQGTLYGRNATGGAINIISNQPTAQPSGYVELSYGNYNDLSLEGAVSGPLAGDKLLARIAAKVEERDGFGRNLTSGKDIDDLKTRAVRGMLEFRPSAGASFLLQGDYFKRDDAAGATHYIGCLAVCNAFNATTRGYTIPADRRDVFSDLDQVNRAEDYGVALISRVELPFADLSSLTAYRSGSLINVFDTDGTAQPGANISREENFRTFSQEFQLSGTSEPLDWLVGLYYFHERNYARANGRFPPYVAPVASVYFQGGIQKTNAYAAFGELNFHVTPALTLIAGGRYSKERKHIIDERLYLNGPGGAITARQAAPSATVRCTVCLGLPDRVSFDAFTPKFGARYEFSSDRQVYVTAQKGFKSGGFAIGAVTPSFEPETLWSYEAGIKARWFDRALTTNLAVYHYDYKDLQLGQVLTTSSIVTNAARAKVDGAELEWNLALGDHLKLDGFGAYNHARFTSYQSRNPGITSSPIFDLSGNLLPNAPKWTGKIGAEYTEPAFAGSLTVRGEFFASSRVFFSEFNNAINSQKPYEFVNAYIRYDGPNDWSLNLYMNNFFNKTVAAGGALVSPLTGGFVLQQYLPPRVYGIRIIKKF